MSDLLKNSGDKSLVWSGPGASVGLFPDRNTVALDPGNSSSKAQSTRPNPSLNNKPKHAQRGGPLRERPKHSAISPAPSAWWTWIRQATEAGHASPDPGGIDSDGPRSVPNEETGKAPHDSI